MEKLFFSENTSVFLLKNNIFILPQIKSENMTDHSTDILKINKIIDCVMQNLLFP